MLINIRKKHTLLLLDGINKTSTFDDPVTGNAFISCTALTSAIKFPFLKSKHCSCKLFKMFAKGPVLLIETFS